MPESQDQGLYYERQRFSLCLKHTLNNLLQCHHFSKRDLDKIAGNLSPTVLGLINPHTFLFLGNHDVNVMQAALEEVGKAVRWHDARDKTFEKLEPNACWGFILNKNCSSSWSRLLGPFASGRHWLGVRKIHRTWYLLDSELLGPVQITDGDSCHQDQQLRGFLRNQLETDPLLHLFIITETSP